MHLVKHKSLLTIINTKTLSSLYINKFCIDSVLTGFWLVVVQKSWFSAVPICDKCIIISNDRNGTVCPAVWHWILSIYQKVAKDDKICHKQPGIWMLEIVSSILLLNADFMLQTILVGWLKENNNTYYYTSDSLWKIWLVESIQSIHNSLWTWHDKCIICCR